MPWVMVPVPEEAEQEFSQWLMRRTMEAALTNWPDGAIADVVAQAEGPMVDMLRAMASGDEMWASAAAVAQVGGVSVDVLLEGVATLNQRCIERSWPTLVMVKTEGATGEENHLVLMAGIVRTEVTRLLRA